MLVLFDLDGTLVDSAPDLHAALAALCAEEGHPPPAPEATRRVVSLGSRALLACALGTLPEDPEAYEALRRRFLARYEATAHRRTVWMDGIPELLQILDARGDDWGIVTNKPRDLTIRVLERLLRPELPKPRTVVAGDSLTRRKPDPAPLLHALREAGARPTQSLYVGDAVADMTAARGAHLRAYVALWGYLGEDPDPAAWGADGLLEHPRDLLNVEALKANDER